MRWAEIAIEATTASADAVANILIEEGCGGTVTDCSSASVPEDTIRVKGYLPVDDRLEDRLGSIRERVGLLPEFGLATASDEISVVWVEDVDWATAWKKFFKPLRVGRIVVKPSWEEYSPRPGDVIVEIDPGMAFGTGSHATTQLCLKALQKHIKGGETVLDMGTGSGILAIAAAKLGAAKVTGLDVDTVATEAAVENVERNSLEERITIARADSPEEFEGTADIVVANIIAKVIIDLARGLYSKTRPGGVLIASGIIVERTDEVREHLESAGFELLEEQRDGEWTALVVRRR